MAPHCQAILRVSGQPLRMVAGPKEASSPDCSVVATPYSSLPPRATPITSEAQGCFARCLCHRSLGTGEPEPRGRQTPSRPLSLGNSAAFLSIMKEPSPQLQHCSNCVLIKGGLMDVAERWLWKSRQSSDSYADCPWEEGRPPVFFPHTSSREEGRSDLRGQQTLTGFYWLGGGKGCAGM